ncbi:hypothetical protein JG687_00010535 [Phytophthora cactorum]|uniref:Uncharacterized protein n=1 Tax=Phytophthora cactorum TaxID=29920 RepID=A0A8T1UAV2_9STRA|nr:hypothetical protein JG687_00010535 [Phytophthora cactorum]
MRIRVRNMTYGGAHGDVVTPLCVQLHVSRRAAGGENPYGGPHGRGLLSR